MAKKLIDYTTMIQSYLDGKTPKELGEQVGVDGSTVYRRLQKLGVQMRNLSTSKVGRPGSTRGKPLLKTRKYDHDDIRKRYASGESLNAIADALGCNDETVRLALKGMAIGMRSRGGKSGSENHQFKGGTRERGDGYVIRRGSRAKPLEHRVIAERALGRRLKRSEDVHHVNFDRSENRNTNLVICTHAYHMELHARMRRHPYWIEVEADYRNKQRKES